MLMSPVNSLSLVSVRAAPAVAINGLNFLNEVSITFM
jgi:hypothetical protein